MQDDAGGVEHRAQRRLRARRARGGAARAPARRRSPARRARGARRAPRGPRARRARAARRRPPRARARRPMAGGSPRPYRTAAARGGGAFANPRYTALPGRGPAPVRAQGQQAWAALRGSADFERRRCHESTGDAAVWPSEPRARAPSPGAHDARRASPRLIAIPFGHLLLRARRGDAGRARRRRAARRRLARARPSARSRAAVGDQLQRDVTVTVSGRSATLSPYDLGVRVNAARTARAGARGRPRPRRPAVLVRLLALRSRR